MKNIWIAETQKSLIYNGFRFLTQQNLCKTVMENKMAWFSWWWWSTGRWWTMFQVRTRQDLGKTGVEDMIKLTDLNEASLLWNLRWWWWYNIDVWCTHVYLYLEKRIIFFKVIMYFFGIYLNTFSLSSVAVVVVWAVRGTCNELYMKA